MEDTVVALVPQDANNEVHERAAGVVEGGRRLSQGNALGCYLIRMRSLRIMAMACVNNCEGLKPKLAMIRLQLAATLNDVELAAISRSAAELRRAVWMNSCISCTSLKLLLEGMMERKKQ